MAQSASFSKQFNATAPAGVEKTFAPSGMRTVFEDLWKQGKIDTSDLWDQGRFWEKRDPLMGKAQKPGLENGEAQTPATAAAAEQIDDSPLQNAIENMNPERRAYLENGLDSMLQQPLEQGSFSFDALARNPEAYTQEYLTKVSPETRTLFEQRMQAVETIATPVAAQMLNDKAADDTHDLEPSHDGFAFMACAIGSGEAGRVHEYLRTRGSDSTLAANNAMEEEEEEAKMTRSMQKQMMLNTITSQMASIDMRIREIDQEIAGIDRRLEEIDEERTQLIQQRNDIEQRNQQIINDELPAAQADLQQAQRDVNQTAADLQAHDAAIADLDQQIAQAQQAENVADDATATALQDSDDIRDNTARIHGNDVYIRNPDGSGWQKISEDTVTNVSQADVDGLGLMAEPVYYKLDNQGQMSFTNFVGTPLNAAQNDKITQGLARAGIKPEDAIASQQQYAQNINNDQVNSAFDNQRAAATKLDDLLALREQRLQARADAQARHDDAVSRRDTAQQRVDALQGELDINNQALDQINDRLNALDTEEADLQARRQELVDEKEGLLEKRAELDEKLGILTADDIEDLKQRTDLTEEQKAMLREREALESKLDALTAEETTLLKQRSALTEEQQNLVDARADITAQNRELFNQQAQAGNVATALSTGMDSYESLNTYSQKALDLEEERINMTRQRDEYSSQMDWEFNDFDTIDAAYEAGVLSEEQLNIYNGYQSTVSSLDDLNSQLVEIDEQILESEQQIAELEAQIEQIEMEKAQAEEQLEFDKAVEEEAKLDVQDAQERRLTNWDGETVHEDDRFMGLGLSYEDAETGEVKEHGFVASVAGQAAHFFQDIWKGDAQTGNEIDEAKTKEQEAVNDRKRSEREVQQAEAKIQEIEQQKAALMREVQAQKAAQNALNPDREYNTSRYSPSAAGSDIANAPEESLRNAFQKADNLQTSIDTAKPDQSPAPPVRDYTVSTSAIGGP